MKDYLLHYRFEAKKSKLIKKTNTMNFDNHIFRSHSVGTIVNLPKPLTANQAETLTDYRNRANGEGRQLTDNQKKTWHSLRA
jgi:hypothetical protein